MEFVQTQALAQIYLTYGPDARHRLLYTSANRGRNLPFATETGDRGNSTVINGGAKAAWFLGDEIVCYNSSAIGLLPRFAAGTRSAMYPIALSVSLRGGGQHDDPYAHDYRR